MSSFFWVMSVMLLTFVFAFQLPLLCKMQALPLVFPTLNCLPSASAAPPDLLWVWRRVAQGFMTSPSPSKVWVPPCGTCTCMASLAMRMTWCNNLDMTIRCGSPPSLVLLWLVGTSVVLNASGFCSSVGWRWTYEVRLWKSSTGSLIGHPRMMWLQQGLHPGN